MKSHLDGLISRHAKTGILLDSNILLLHFVGSFDQNLIPHFKRTNTFVIEDYSTLEKFLKYFKQILTTPHILTEVSNLSFQLPVSPDTRKKYFEQFSHEISVLEEHSCASSKLADCAEFKKFGLTDTAIFHLAESQQLVLTDDFPLSQYLQSKCVDVLNFNHIRPLGWK